jgi:hypothetical protein
MEDQARYTIHDVISAVSSRNAGQLTAVIRFKRPSAFSVPAGGFFYFPLYPVFRAPNILLT